MASQSGLDELVRRKLKKGFPAGELRQELKGLGYTEEEINAAINSYAQTQMDRTGNKAGFNSSGSMLSLAGISLLIVGIALSSVNFSAGNGPLNVFSLAGLACLSPWLIKKIGAAFRR